MDARTREVLQFDLVLERIAGKAASSLGKEYVLALEPAKRLIEVNDRFQPVRDLLAILAANQSLPIDGLSDIRPLLDKARISGSLLDEENWPPIIRFLLLCRRMSDFREQINRKYSSLARLLAPIEPFIEMQQAVERTFDKDGMIRDDASQELYAARRALRSAEQRLLKTISRLVSDFHSRGILQESFSTLRNGRHVFPVKAGSRSKLPGIIQGSSASGETVYVEPSEVVEASNEVETLRDAERREVARILLELTNQLRAHLPFLRESIERLREVDGLYAISRNANSRGWNIPIIVEDGALRLFNAHHPLLHLGDGQSVPITMLLDRSDRCVVLSGPNAGGKTTAMKMLGLLSLLAQCGSPVPAFPDSTLPLFSNVLADIGDQQDLQQGISTFSGHMRRIAEIWKQSGPRTLVLMDELGTGTDPQEGGALALALLEGFAKRSALTMTTSHLNPVKQWAEDTEGVRNASFSLDPQTHEPTFRLRLDLPGASEALEIAEKEKLPSAILSRARELVGERHLRMGELLRRIEVRERQLALAAKEAEARATSLAEQEALARARAEMLRTERREMKEAALRERHEVISHTRERLEKLIADLPSEEELQRRREALLAAREQAIGEQSLTADERRRIAERQLEAGEYFIGQKVYVPSLRQWGEITRFEAEGKKARVTVGRLEVSLRVQDILDHDPVERRAEQKSRAEDLETLSSGSRPNKKSRRNKNALRNAQEYSGPSAASRVTFGGRTLMNVSRPSSMTLDLHGYRVEEALAELDRFLDRSLLASFPHVKICHGTGTGRLYKAVHEYLRQHQSVKAFRFATPDEGGGGTTVVDL